MEKLSETIVLEYKYDSCNEREQHVKLMELQGFESGSQVKRSDDSIMDENRHHYWYGKHFKYIPVSKSVDDDVEMMTKIKTCSFCEKADFGSFSAKVDDNYAMVHLAGGYYRFPKDDQFRFCPECGRRLEGGIDE